MHKTLNLIGKIICYAFMAIGIVFCVLILIKSSDIKTDIGLQNSLVVPAIIISMVAVIFCAFVSLILPLFFTTYTKKKLMNIGLLILGIIVLFVIAWIMPDAQLSAEYMEEMKINQQISKWVGVGCYLAYFSFAGAIIAVIYSAVMSFIKNR
ncbi:MAG: hypothetical protein LBP67_07000 [Bacteroidales bacterium]|jgi:predicted neutral ceramidase superfamily lipid hydrolase|nr:hypothetical protein [Bacteroidales bacterium]